jgi:hypothetical protein
LHALRLHFACTSAKCSALQPYSYHDTELSPPVIHAGACPLALQRNTTEICTRLQSWAAARLKLQIVSLRHRPPSQMSHIPVRTCIPTRTTPRCASPAILTETRVKTPSWRGCDVIIAEPRPPDSRVRAPRPGSHQLFWNVSPMPSPGSGGTRSASQLNTARAATILVCLASPSLPLLLFR